MHFEQTLVISKRALFTYNKDMNYFNYEEVHSYLSNSIPHFGGEPVEVGSVIDDGETIIVSLNYID